MTVPQAGKSDDSRLLIVDDNKANTSLLEQILRRAGYTSVIVCNDSREVPLLLETETPDLVLLDLHMPHMDGFTILELLRYHADGRFLPIIVLTADTARASAIRALELGAHDLVSKPFDITEIQLRVRNLLRTRQAYQELRRHNSQLRDYVDVLEMDADTQLDPWSERRERIESMLERGDPRMVFQPVVDLVDDKHVGYEALARFDGAPMRSPDRWFLEALTVGLGPDLETRALCNALVHLPDLETPQFLAVNLSPGAILSEPYRRVSFDVAWDRVVIELTEHTNIDDYSSVLRALQPWRDLGARLSVDDAGAGFASLRHILQLSPDFIKLDISICRGVDIDPARSALASALVAFAGNTGSLLIAEGIETPEERRALMELGVRFGQGYLLGRPGELPESYSTSSA